MPAIVPILLYIGLLIGAQAFQVRRRNCTRAAVVAALIPNIAAWATGLIDNALAAAGTTADQVGDDGAGRRRRRLPRADRCSAQGAILAGLVLGAIVAFIIDKRFVARRDRGAVGAALSFIGLIHAPSVGWNANGQVALGYVFMAVVCAGFAATRPQPRVPDDEELALDAEHSGVPVPEPAATHP